jgi:hypothetical protein
MSNIVHIVPVSESGPHNLNFNVSWKKQATLCRNPGILSATRVSQAIKRMKAATRITMTSTKPNELKLRSLTFVNIIKEPLMKSVIKGTVAIAVTIKFQVGERSRPENISFMKSTKENIKSATLHTHKDIHRLARTHKRANKPYKVSIIESLIIF